MSYDDDLPIGNFEERIPFILLLDVSGSMAGAPIEALAKGLPLVKSELDSDAKARLSVEVAIVTFAGDARQLCDFVTVNNFAPPHTLQTEGGGTNLVAGLTKCLDILDLRIRHYKNTGTSFKGPWLWLMTDGQVSDSPELDDVRQRAKSMIESKHRLNFFTIAINEEAMSSLVKLNLSPNHPVQIDGLKFTQMFKWISVQLTKISHSQKGDKISLDKPSEWAADV